MQTSFNTYIHIPFCKSKCKYCSFVSYTDIEKKEQYLKALKKEVLHYYQKEALKTIYIGGGTPSLLEISEIEHILNLFNFDNNAEITIELNPESVSQNYLTDLHKIGINRISFGCQTFDDNILKLIGRLHNSNQVKKAVKYAQNVGFDNINLDFIYGLPTQTINGFEKDLKQAMELEIQHISLYGLKIDEGCYFYKHKPENLPDDDMQADMYLKAVEILKDYNHYEISNFGIPSKHNLNYWNNNSYYGFGAAAHGYIGDTRYSNFNDIDKYIETPLKRENEITLTKQNKLEEEIFLGFRKLSGINIKDINKKYGIDFEKKYNKILEKYRDYFVISNGCYALNTQGILISNSILSEFIDY